jgi:hypothetical protein
MSSHRFIGDLPGRLMRALLLVGSALLILSFSSTSHAYPWMIKHGFAKCASCHTDPMGGETLTGFGRVISDTTLSTRYDGSTDPTRNAMLFFGVVEPEWLNLGGSVRVMDADYQFPKNGAPGTFDYFPMQMDAYGQVRFFRRLRVSGSLGVGDATKGRIESRAAQITENNANGDLNLISRTHWVGYDISDDVLVRAGRINLPFGIRMSEHTMWVRAATRTDRESQQQDGAAVDYSGGRFRGEIMAIAGNYQISPDKFRERGYSAYGEYLLDPHTAVGLSSLVTHAADDRFLVNGQPYTRQAHGVTGRWSPMEPLAILAEADVLFSNQTKVGYVGMVQGDYEFVQGFHGILTGEILDAGLSTAAGTVAVPGAGQPKVGGWITAAWYFFTHFDVRADLIVHQAEPVTLLSQFHYYF